MLRAMSGMVAVLGLILVSGCGGSGKPPAATVEAPQAAKAGADAPAETKVVTVKVDGMTCEGCARGVAMSLKETEGIVDAQVDFDAGEATVTVDAAKYDTPRVIEIIKKAGWDASEKVAEADAPAAK